MYQLSHSFNSNFQATPYRICIAKKMSGISFFKFRMKPEMYNNNKNNQKGNSKENKISAYEKSHVHDELFFEITNENKWLRLLGFFNIFV